METTRLSPINGNRYDLIPKQAGLEYDWSAVAIAWRFEVNQENIA